MKTRLFATLGNAEIYFVLMINNTLLYLYYVPIFKFINVNIME